MQTANGRCSVGPNSSLSLGPNSIDATSRTGNDIKSKVMRKSYRTSTKPVFQTVEKRTNGDALTDIFGEVD